MIRSERGSSSMSDTPKDAAEVTLQKRRHPDGFLLWDVYADGRLVGVARQHAVEAPSWFAYDLRSDEAFGRFPYRRDAVAAVVERAS